MTGPRLAVRAVTVAAGRLLLVNAYPGDASDLWCAPGGGAERGASLEANLRREVAEETGLEVLPGRLLAVTEFMNPATGFHQVELYFRAPLADPAAAATLRDPEGVVNRLRWAVADELASLRFKPDCLPRIAFGPDAPVVHEPLELMAPP
ncbi:MAG TPA: NUDIX domain-containing protein [Amaricoccus sp.]|nr:NUDIX domain-containing protein [Amaricoccus sp.]